MFGQNQNEAAAIAAIMSAAAPAPAPVSEGFLTVPPRTWFDFYLLATMSGLTVALIVHLVKGSSNGR